MLKKIIQLSSTFFPSFLRVLIYRILGADIAEGARIMPFTVLVVKQLKLHAYSRIAGFSVVMGLTELELGASSEISRMCYITGSGKLRLGQRSRIGIFSQVEVHLANFIMGDYSGLGPHCLVNTHGIFLPATRGFMPKIGDVEIGNNVYIQSRCYIGPAVKICNDVIALPGSALLKDVNKSGVVFDSGIDRKVFPLGIFKEEVNPQWSQQYLIKMISFVVDRIADKFNYSSKQTEYGFELFSKRKKIQIILSLNEKIPQNKNQEIWCFDNTIKLTNFNSNKIINFDLNDITFSGKLTAEVKKTMSLLQTYFGLRFIEKRLLNGK